MHDENRKEQHEYDSNDAFNDSDDSNSWKINSCKSPAYEELDDISDNTCYSSNIFEDQDSMDISDECPSGNDFEDQRDILSLDDIDDEFNEGDMNSLDYEYNSGEEFEDQGEMDSLDYDQYEDFEGHENVNHIDDVDDLDNEEFENQEDVDISGHDYYSSG